MRVVIFGATVAAVFAVLAAAPVHAADPKRPGALAADLPPAPPAPPPGRCVCTREYRPVCGRLPDGTARTFPNACMAGCAGAAVVRPGTC